jgi:hypothetical protein
MMEAQPASKTSHVPNRPIFKKWTMFAPIFFFVKLDISLLAKNIRVYGGCWKIECLGEYVDVSGKEYRLHKIVRCELSAFYSSLHTG